MLAAGTALPSEASKSSSRRDALLAEHAMIGSEERRYCQAVLALHQLIGGGDQNRVGQLDKIASSLPIRGTSAVSVDSGPPMAVVAEAPLSVASSTPRTHLGENSYDDASGIVDDEGNNNNLLSIKSTDLGRHVALQIARLYNNSASDADVVIYAKPDGSKAAGPAFGVPAVRVHRLVLASVSPFLKQTLAATPQATDLTMPNGDSDNGILPPPGRTFTSIFLPDAQRTDVRLLFKFVYAGRAVAESREQVVRLHRLADALQIKIPDSLSPDDSSDKDELTTETTLRQTELPPCNFCSHPSLDNDKQTQHSVAQPAPPSSNTQIALVCPLCSNHFTQPAALRQHVLSHLNSAFASATSEGLNDVEDGCSEKQRTSWLRSAVQNGDVICKNILTESSSTSDLKAPAAKRRRNTATTVRGEGVEDDSDQLAGGAMRCDKCDTVMPSHVALLAHKQVACEPVKRRHVAQHVLSPPPPPQPPSSQFNLHATHRPVMLHHRQPTTVARDNDCPTASRAALSEHPMTRRHQQQFFNSLLSHIDKKQRLQLTTSDGVVNSNNRRQQMMTSAPQKKAAVAASGKCAICSDEVADIESHMQSHRTNMLHTASRMATELIATADNSMTTRVRRATATAAVDALPPRSSQLLHKELQVRKRRREPVSDPPVVGRTSCSRTAAAVDLVGKIASRVIFNSETARSGAVNNNSQLYPCAGCDQQFARPDLATKHVASSPACALATLSPVSLRTNNKKRFDEEENENDIGDETSSETAERGDVQDEFRVKIELTSADDDELQIHVD